MYLLLVWREDNVVGGLHSWSHLGHWPLTDSGEVRRLIVGHLDMSGNLRRHSDQIN